MFGRVTELVVGFQAEDDSMNGVLQRMLDMLSRYGRVTGCFGGYWGQQDGFVRFNVKDLKEGSLEHLCERMRTVLGVCSVEVGNAKQTRHRTVTAA